MFFIVIAVHSLKTCLLESISRCCVHSRCIPFASWVLCVLFLQFVRMLICFRQFCYVCTIDCKIFHAARVVILLNGLCM
jgi:hypothetical protein